MCEQGPDDAPTPCRLRDVTGAVEKMREGQAGVRYLPVGRFFLNEELGPVGAWRLLWEQQRDFLGNEGKQVGEDAHRGLPFRLLGTTKLALRFLAARFGSGDGALELPLSGDIAIERLSGAVKLLDLAGNRVFTIMRDDAMRGKLSERIEAAESVASWPFAPGFHGADAGQGWLAEEYIPGEHPTGFRGCNERFEEYYLPLLVDFLLAEAPVAISFAAYTDSLRADIFAADGLLREVEPGLRSAITEFVNDLLAGLDGVATGADREIKLVRSHGDFFSGNVIITPQGTPRAIDWATTGTRSPLYDLYYLVMNHCVRVLTPAQRQRRFSEMLGLLRSALGKASPDRLAGLDEDLKTASALRRLFYLECVHVPLMHCVDPEDRYIRSLATRIDWFKEYELALKDDDMQLAMTAANTGTINESVDDLRV